MVAALQFSAGGVSPGVVVDLDTHDQMGREIEWTWNLGGGLWRPVIKGGLVTIEVCTGSAQYLGGGNPFVLQRGEASGEYGFADERQRLAEIERRNRCPFPGAFLSGGVENLIDDRFALFGFVTQAGETFPVCFLVSRAMPEASSHVFV